MEFPSSGKVMVRIPKRSEEEIAIKRWENEGGEIPELAAISSRSQLASEISDDETYINPDPNAKHGANRRITGFHQDDERHWVAELECGHKQHVRHDPPLTARAWVTTAEGRRDRIGRKLHCKQCDVSGLQE